MTGALRLALVAGAALAVAAVGAGLAGPRRAGVAGVQVAAALPAAGAAAPAVAAPGARDDVPAGILSRAADARALDRAECRGTPQDPAACGRQPDPVEIDWDVRRAP